MTALFEERIAEVVAAFEQGLAHPDPWEGFVSTLETILGLQAEDRGLKDLLLRDANSCERLDGARRRIAPLSAQLLERAQADGSVRPDVVSSDVALLQVTLGSIMDASRDVDPELWRRFLALSLDGLRTSREGFSPLPGPGLEPEQVPHAMRACAVRR